MNNDPDVPARPRPDPFALLAISAVATATGWAAGHGSSFDLDHQLVILVHGVVGTAFIGVLLGFVGPHLRSVADRPRARAWLAAIAVYAFARETLLREAVPFLFVFAYVVPLLLVWRLVPKPWRARILAAATLVPGASVVFVVARGRGIDASAFEPFYYAEVLCLVAAYVVRSGTLVPLAEPQGRARHTGLLTTFASLGAFLSGAFLGVGAGQMQVGQAFLDAHRVLSWGFAIVLVAHRGLVHTSRGASTRRLAPISPRRVLTAVALGVMVPGAYLAVRAAARAADPPPERPRFDSRSMAEPSRWQTTSGNTLSLAEFGGSQVCRACHPSQGEGWERSAHHRAASPLFRILVDEARAALGPDGGRYCLGCHAPTAVVTGELAGDGSPSETSLEEGVGCLACHAVESAHPEPGNASLIAADDPALLFERRGGYAGVTRMLFRMTPRLHRHRYSKPAVSTAELCGSCHREVLDPRLSAHSSVIQDQWTSWSESRYGRARSHVPCRGCHMPRTEVSEFDEGIHDHRFLGGSSARARAEGDEETVALLEAWLAGDRGAWIDAAKARFREHYLLKGRVSQGAGVSDEVFEATIESLWQDKLAGREFPAESLWPAGPLLDVRIEAVSGADPPAIELTITNRAIGHVFPAGPLDLVDAWLHVEVRDAAGAIVLTSGAEAIEGQADASTRRFGGTPVDAAGRPIRRHRIWEIAAHEGVRLVAPDESVRERFELPPATVGPLEVRAEVLQRLPGAAITREVLGSAAPLAAPDVITRSETRLP